MELTKEQLQRRLVLLSQIAQSLSDELLKLGYGDGTYVNEENSGLLGKCITDLYVLADPNNDYSETCFKTDIEHEEDVYASYPEFTEAIKQLKEYGCIYVNHWSTDCDGCSAADNCKFDSVRSLEDWLNSSYEWAEGSWGWDYATPDNLVREDARGYWGM